MKYLVTGGAGYIGSFMVKRLLDDGHTVVVIDSLERGYEKALSSGVIFKKGSLLDKAFVDSVFTEHSFDGVFHFAAYISVAESSKNPGMYFNNNVFASLGVLDAMVKHNVTKLLFSSTAAVYGNPQIVPIPEDHPKDPESPYGETKLMVEALLKWYQQIHGLNYVVLRYFNACGGAIDGSMGENHDPETHIIPNAIRAALKGSDFTLYGQDYPTPDGTCVRDYIHVLDLIEAHVLGMNAISNGEKGAVYNVGTGKGFSNKEILSEIEKVSGQPLKIVQAERRVGDPAELVADSSKIKNDLQFVPQFSDISTIISSAWKWHAKSDL